MTLSALNQRDAEIATIVGEPADFLAHAIRRAERERDLADLCAAESEAQGDRLAMLEFTAEASGWQRQIDVMEERL